MVSQTLEKRNLQFFQPDRLTSVDMDVAKLGSMMTYFLKISHETTQNAVA